MKKFFLILSLALLCHNVIAQDIIITQSDEIIKAYNLEIGNNTVFYQLSQDSDAPVQKITKSDIFIIKKADGTRFDPNEKTTDNAEAKPESNQGGQVQVQRKVDEKRRQEIIDYYTADATLKPLKRRINGLKKMAKSKKVKVFYAKGDAFWRPSKNSDVCNEDIEFYIQPRTWHNDYDEYNRYHYRNYSIYLINRSKRTIFVDLANTFTVSPKGEFSNYYNGTITTSTKGAAGGVGVNLGHGITVGGGSSTSSTTTEVEQRIVSIPPGGKMKVTNDFLFPDSYGMPDSIFDQCEAAFQWDGNQLDIDGESLPSILFSATYSFTQDFKQYSILTSKLVMYKITLFYHDEYLRSPWIDQFGIENGFHTEYEVKSGHTVISTPFFYKVKSSNVIIPDEYK